MGRTVINQTENKQTVILNDSPEGVEGGYFDADMVWHDLGSGGVMYNYTLDDVLLMHGAITIDDQTNRLKVTMVDRNRRRCFMFKDGVQSAQLYGDAGALLQDDSYLYPIPIPEDAAKVTITITPAERYIGPAFYTWDGSTYTRESDPGWNQGSYETTLTPGEYHYLSVASKYDSAGSSYPSEPTAFSIIFEKE